MPAVLENIGYANVSLYITICYTGVRILISVGPDCQPSICLIPTVKIANTISH